MPTEHPRVRPGVGAPRGPSSGPQPLEVLIAEDERDTADTTAMLVRHWGHSVRVAHDGPEALRAALELPPHVLWLDIALPRIDGYELARRLRSDRHFAGTLFIAVTGYADDAHRRRGSDAGFDLYFAKPVNPLLLQDLLAVEQRRRQAAAPGRTARPRGVLLT